MCVLCVCVCVDTCLFVTPVRDLDVDAGEDLVAMIADNDPLTFSITSSPCRQNMLERTLVSSERHVDSCGVV